MKFLGDMSYEFGRYYMSLTSRTTQAEHNFDNQPAISPFLEVCAVLFQVSL